MSSSYNPSFLIVLAELAIYKAVDGYLLIMARTVQIAACVTRKLAGISLEIWWGPVTLEFEFKLMFYHPHYFTIQ